MRQIAGEALAAMLAIEDERARAEALTALASPLAALPFASLYPAWQTALRLVASRPRHSLLSDLSSILPVVASLAGLDAIPGILGAIQDVGRWWP